MGNLTGWISGEECEFIKAKDQEWLVSVFKRFSGYPTLEQIWALMDEAWRLLNCDPTVMDERISAFYSHPVWLLNGLLIEQHALSMENRRQFSDWVVGQSPRRVAEFGGGFGGLARLIGEGLPTAEVEVIEPHPHQIAIVRAEKTVNVRYQPVLSGEYDVMIATDVFEHVPDPLRLVAVTAAHLRLDGVYLIANCFLPVILCHLPQVFHFRYSWDFALRAMGFEPMETVVYGRAFVLKGPINLDAGRRVENLSRKFWAVTQYLPARIGYPLTKLLLSIFK